MKILQERFVKAFVRINSRRGAALAICLGFTISPGAIRLAHGAPADLVVRSVNVLTMDAQQPRAQAVAVKDGRFLAVGNDAEIAALIGPETRVLDLPGRTLTPGFIDAHAHPQSIYPPDSPYASVPCGPEAVASLDALVAALRRKAEQTPPGQWVLGSRYQETKLGRHPTRLDLDLASTNHPILISHSSGHRSVCNSFALRLAKVDRDTEDPPGGTFERDADGEPTGVLLERAAGIVRARGPARPTPPEDATIAGYRKGFHDFLARGITTVGVAGTSLSSVDLLEKARASGPPLRLAIMLREANIEEAARRQRQNSFAESGIRFGAIKIFHGNSLSGQTCWLSQPYVDRPGYFGVPPARAQSDLDTLVWKIHEAGLQACVHANGDREIEMVLRAIGQALERLPRANHRHRIEHGSVVTEALLQRIKALGVVMVPHSYIWEHGDKMESYGAWRWEWMHPARSLLDLGIPMAAHSDYPVSAADPLLRMQDLVLRQSAEGKVYGASQRITAEEALRAWTAGGAYALFEEDRLGTIAAGRLADFVILKADPTRVPPDTIRHVAVAMTFVGGEKAYDAEETER